MLEELLKRIGRSQPTVCECRRCGTNLDPGATRCPRCDAEDVVCYEVE